MTEEHDTAPRAPRWWLWLAVSVVIVIADQLTKAAVMAALRPSEERVITSFLSIVLAFNAGAAFSFLSGAAGWQRYLFGGVAVAAAVVIVWLLRRGGDGIYCAGLSLILGGALGNLWDRATIGTVVDFVLFHNYLPWRPGIVSWLDPFPAFNVADSAITIGAALLILDSFRLRRHERRASL